MEKDGIKGFIEESGLKLLSLAGVSKVEYSVLLYLLHCHASNLKSLVMNEIELATLLGHGVSETKEALADLSERKMIKLQYGDLTQKPKNQSFRVSMNLKTSEWVIDENNPRALPGNIEKVVFPFRTKKGFKLLTGEKSTRKGSQTQKKVSKKAAAETPDWRAIVEAFGKNRKLSTAQLHQAEKNAKTLLATYAFPQILLLIRHFGVRIPALSLLASSWHHYTALFDEETSTVDLQGARQKNLEIDEKIRDFVKRMLDERRERKFTEEEVTVLEILAHHKHPRRQLFWAYQSRHNYTNLQDLFENAPEWMLPVTNGGQFVRLPD